ncbi:hypothetical protein R50072_08380 [Simiduia litorea]
MLSRVAIVEGKQGKYMIRKTFLTQILLSMLVLVGLPSVAVAKNVAPAKVMLVGVFHFSNPGLDKVKTDQINVMSDDNQRYLFALSKRFAEFKPTHVLLECSLERTTEYYDQFQKFLIDDELPGVNENYQLGFRIAKLAGLDSTHCYDERKIGWDADQLFSDLESKDAEAKQAFEQFIAEITEQTTENHKTLSLAELLRLSNEPKQDSLNKNLYLLTNQVGAGDNFSGADAAASWWHRNFRMYANIQKIAQPGTRIIVLGGQGHTAILKDLVNIDQRRELVDSKMYF